MATSKNHSEPSRVFEIFPLKELQASVDSSVDSALRGWRRGGQQQRNRARTSGPRRRPVDKRAYQNTVQTRLPLFLLLACSPISCLRRLENFASTRAIPTLREPNRSALLIRQLRYVTASVKGETHSTKNCRLFRFIL